MIDLIVVFEPNMNSSPHSEINAGLLSVFEGVFPSHSLDLIVDKRHYNAISKKKDLKNWNIKFSKVFTYKPSNFLINDFLLILKFLWIFIHYKRNSATYIFLGIMPLSHCFISLINQFTKKDIIICLHGQMEAYLENTKIGKSRYYYYLSKNVFKRNDYLRYIVFGESIKTNIKFLFKDLSKIIVIDQPYLYPEEFIVDSKPDLMKRPFILGVIGRGDKGKNISEIFTLINELKDDIKQGKLKIVIVGKMSVTVPENLNNLIDFQTDTIPTKKFEKEVLGLDFALSFTGKDFYKVTPSGAFFDCIKWEIPILSLDNDFTSYYFSKYGPLGELFSTTFDMSLWIKNVILENNLDESFYTQIQQNYQTMKRELSIDNIVVKLQTQL